MSDIDEIIQANPKAASQLEAMKDTIELLRELRAAGLAGRSGVSPVDGRQSLGELKRSKIRFEKSLYA